MKRVDNNGFWRIERNPISKVGVFPYLGRQIDPSLEPDKVYMVLRPADELFNEEAIESFNKNPVPLVDDHTMIGEEFTPAEEKGVDGVVNNIRRDGDTLVGDISIYSEKMKKKIASGKKDLSMGYFCTYDLSDGDFNGEHYDAIQRNIRSNHIALVDRGRCGHDVRVFDRWCFDCAIAEDVEFKESEHPRDKNGQFTSGSGGGNSGGSGNKHSLMEHVFIATPEKSSTKQSNSEESKGTNTQTNPNSNNSTNPSEKKYPYREYSKDYPDEYMEWHKSPTGIGRYGVYHGIDPNRVKIVVHGARIQESIYERYEEFGNISQKLRGQIFEYSKEPFDLFNSYTNLKALKEMLADSFTKSNSYLYKKEDRKEILKGMQNAFKKVNELAESTAKNSRGAKILSKFKSTTEEFNSFLDKCAQKAAERGFNSKEYIDQFKIKNTANDSGVNASSGDANFQSKVKELRTMIDKEKLAALKELVAMLESDSPAGDAKPCDELPDEEKENLFEEKEEEKPVKDESVDKRELIREIGAIAGKALSEEDVKTIMQKCEQLAYSDSEASADDEEPEEVEEIKEDVKESEDELPRKIFEMIAERDKLIKKISPIIGNFDYSKMTVDQVAKYACDKLDIKSAKPIEAINGYLKGYTKQKVYSIDSAVKHSSDTNEQIEKYLKGE